MRNIASLLLGLIFISETVVLAEEKPVRSISVSGTAQVRTAPDHIVWAISLGDNDKNLLAAKKKSESEPINMQHATSYAAVNDSE